MWLVKHAGVRFGEDVLFRCSRCEMLCRYLDVDSAAWRVGAYRLCQLVAQPRGRAKALGEGIHETRKLAQAEDGRVRWHVGHMAVAMEGHECGVTSGSEVDVTNEHYASAAAADQRLVENCRSNDTAGNDSESW